VLMRFQKVLPIAGLPTGTSGTLYGAHSDSYSEFASYGNSFNNEMSH
jgi:hypothetical protein